MFERIGIVGAGAMGRGIAQLFASAGKQVWLHDARSASISEALRRAAGDAKDPVIVINADAKATHQSVVDIMQAAQSAG